MCGVAAMAQAPLLGKGDQANATANAPIAIVAEGITGRHGPIQKNTSSRL